VPKTWLELLLKVEDPNFRNHKGIDFSTHGAGLTTITQGLAKFMYFESFKPGFAKIEQTLIARFVINNHFSKDEQLEILINHVYLGHFNGERVTGFSEASHVYFGKSFLDLTESEYISLVAMFIGPNAFNVIKQSKKNKLRVERIKDFLNGKYIPKDLSDTYYNG
jgi:membrane carboxypeptidase/penicillin-binding protein